MGALGGKRWRLGAAETTQSGDGGLEPGERPGAEPAAGDVAPDPALGPGVELTVAQVLQPAAGIGTATVTEHPQEGHVHFDARHPVIDPPELDDFLAVVDRYEQRVAAVAARFLDDPRDVEEAVQDTFVQAWRHRDEFRSDAAVFTWLYRIATNSALMRLRRRRHTTVSLDHVAPAELADDPLAERPDQLAVIDEVRAALAELPEHHRLAVLLRDVEGWSNAEAAELLGLPVTTVKAHLHRGRAALRRRLGPR